MNQFPVYKKWLLDELYYLFNSLEDSPECISPPWPREWYVHPDDVRETIKNFNEMFEETRAECGLAEIVSKLAKPLSIDSAFYSFHIIGHILIQDVRADLSQDSLVDIGHEELVCSLFAAICCNRYFGMPSFTANMVQEISAVLADNATAEQSEPDRKPFSPEERLIDVSKMLDLLIQSESIFLQ